MGCVKSKQAFLLPATFEAEGRHGSEECFMSEERFPPREPSALKAAGEGKDFPRANPVVTDYADRLAQEILQDALKQWACNNIKYHDIPYIESEGP
ncbi:small membrane A-kinase anchor protein [Ctenodactylus gundi]